MTESATANGSPNWRSALAALRQPKVAVMLFLGFATGLPFMLVGNTLGYWLREESVELSTIGFLSWVGFAYSAKFLWAPFVDKISVPFFGKWLGARRGWILASQIIVAVALFSMATVQPLGSLQAFGVLALVAAFASATQDIVIDAWRIESAKDGKELAMLSTVYQMGYRGALLVTDALILILAARIGWGLSYELMAALMGVGMIACLFAKEPQATRLPHVGAKLLSARGAFDAIIGPFIAFFKSHKQWAVLMLVLISFYRLADFVMGPMANPMYADLGFDKEVVGAVRGSFGLVATIFGTAAAGMFALRYGLIATLIAGAIVGPASNLAFAWLAWSGPDATVLSITMVIDNFSGGFAGIALIAYMAFCNRIASNPLSLQRTSDGSMRANNLI